MCAEKIRLFVAADITDEIRELISDAMRGLQGEGMNARWVKPENLHLTLKFIGEYGEDGLDRLSNELRVAAERSKPFTAVLTGCGAFPSPRKARILWVGMHGGVEEASKVARKLDARLEKVGVKREQRPFRGHITLARLRQAWDCTAVLESMNRGMEGLHNMPFRVEEIVLYRSMLEPQGPIYTALERMTLGGARGEEG
ncbi:MAG: RNA 2',3'-cyclic phosphodiesterase [Actinobacteria bacterium]|jgi:2'-5' RNA ligase|nr:MAG: RNA 2',3'-cyclic phosphodiesterase [Actinomycetota bacterium]